MLGQRIECFWKGTGRERGGARRFCMLVVAVIDVVVGREKVFLVLFLGQWVLLRYAVREPIDLARLGDLSSARG